VTGFLGSGKTTLIRRLLTHPGMNRVAVVINEFGEVGIDNALVAASSENIALLANGCLCCTVRTDLQETLRELFAKRRAGEVIDFDASSSRPRACRPGAGPPDLRERHAARGAVPVTAS
jgi:G3E family GTPase